MKKLLNTEGENGGGMNWEVGIEIHMLLYKGEVTTETLYIAQETQCPAAT